MKLTQQVINRLAYNPSGSSQQIYWDDALPGFGVRVYPNGAKSYVGAYRANGRRKMQVLGSTASMSLTDARIAAITLSAKAGGGYATRFGDLAEDYIADKQYLRSHKENERRIRKHLVPAFGKKLVTDIKREHVQKLHDRIQKTGKVEANRVIILVQRIINWGKDCDRVPYDYRNPVDGVRMTKEYRRDRWVSQTEMPKLIHEIEELENEYTRAALWLYLLLAVRKEELLRVKHEDILWDDEMLRLTRTKNGRVHTVPLPTLALEIIRGIPKKEGNPYLFPGRKPGRPLLNINKTWAGVRKRAGIPDVTIHDLRRTAASWLIQDGNPVKLIQSILNHTDETMTMIYARFSKEQEREALNEHAKKLAKLRRQD